MNIFADGNLPLADMITRAEKHIDRIPLTESAHIVVSTMVWVGFAEPLFPLGFRGSVGSSPFTSYSFGRELTPDFAGAATAFIL